MAESRRYGLSTQLDIEQILLEAQHRWLRPAEICEILRNYQKFRIAPEPAHKPPSGSLFLFDRKVLRYFRKDGHNWRKKKDGKTVKEAHERLKAGSIDVLHCYYAHGEENENFQRRSYWLLEEDHSNIVLVHYREVKGNRANFNRIKEVEGAIPISPNSEGVLPSSEVDSSVSSRFNSYNHQVNSQTTDTASLNSTQASEYEDVESAYRHQTSSGLHSFLELQPRLLEKMEGGLPPPYYPVPFSTAQGHKGQSSVSTSTTSEPQKHLDFPSWEEILENSGSGIQSVPFQPSVSSNSQNTMVSNHGQGNELLTQLPADDGFGRKQEISRFSQQQYGWQSPEGVSSNASKWSTDGRLDQDSYHLGLEGVDYGDLFNSASSMHTNLAEKDRHCAQNGFQEHLAYEGETALKLDVNNSATIEGKAEHCPPKQPLLDNFRKESLKKLDSFDRWMSKELGDVNESHMQSSSGSYWETVENEGRVDDSSLANQAHLDSYMLGPSLSQDQHFSIIDFSPNWAYAGSEIKVLITGKFLKSHEDLESCKWSCMFGEVEVPAEVIGDGVLRCHTPLHEAGRVPFYVTCSNRLACSEVREFEYRAHNFQDTDILDGYSGNTNEILLRMRFSKFLSLESASSTGSVPSSPGEDSHVSVEINSLLKEDNSEWEQMLNFPSEGDFSMEKVKDQLLQKLLKEKLRVWLLQKVAEGGKGASVLDEDGQGVLHFAAALGYDWAILPILAAGVNVNFRDVNGWTGLHWAAFYGRERTVGILITQGAAAGAVTDPTPACTTGQTPADLASSRGHKGIAGYLGESALSSHLYLLELKDPKEGDAVVQTVSERVATPLSDGDLPHGLSLKDSLAAVCNATQAAARIHQVFRVQSFQRKQQEFDGDKLETSEERLLSLAVKKSRLGRHDEPVQAAAVRIQNKFRSWKGRREFLTIRQQIVKIQAHVRGHQVRKNYRKIIWSVGILDKVILRWRRKGSGLRGFKKEPIAPAPIMEQATTSNDDDFDFLKEGRKQTEERLHKALARVKSMVQYPEARDQYRRLLNVVTEMQETKAVYEKVLNDTEETVDFDDDLIDLDALLGDDNDDTFMPTAI